MRNHKMFHQGPQIFLLGVLSLFLLFGRPATPAQASPTLEPEATHLTALTAEREVSLIPNCSICWLSLQDEEDDEESSEAGRWGNVSPLPPQ